MGGNLPLILIAYLEKSNFKCNFLNSLQNSLDVPSAEDPSSKSIYSVRLVKWICSSKKTPLSTVFRPGKDLRTKKYLILRGWEA